MVVSFGCWRVYLAVKDGVCVAMDGGGLLTNGVFAGPQMYAYPWTMAGEEDISQCISFLFPFFVWIFSCLPISPNLIDMDGGDNVYGSFGF